MYTTIALVSSLVYGGDIDKLGSREYREREAAQSRLRAAGLLAAPAVWRGMEDGCLERSSRCERLNNVMGGWADRLAVLVLDEPTFDPSVVFKTMPGMAQRVCDVVSARSAWETVDPWEWVCRTPYRTGTDVGDFLLVVQSARTQRETVRCSLVGGVGQVPCK